MKKYARLLLIFWLSFLLVGCGAAVPREDAGGSVAVAERTATEASVTDEDTLAAVEGGTEESAQMEVSDSTEDESISSESDSTENESTEDGFDLSEGSQSVGESGSSEGSQSVGESGSSEGTPSAEAALPEDGVYTSKEDVALYLHIYGRLPDNFITKKEAEALGWEGGSLEPYAPGKCIGGNRFGNYEGLLPEAKGRSYTECDIDTLGADRRGAKRIVFSNDGLIYYTEDHYASFELLYGEE